MKILPTMTFLAISIDFWPFATVRSLQVVERDTFISAPQIFLSPPTIPWKHHHHHPTIGKGPDLNETVDGLGGGTF